MSLVSGALAGAMAKTVIAPLDRTKIVFQISQTPYSWRGVGEFLRETCAKEGVRGLWRGNSATAARIAPYAAVQFTAHEHWKRLLGVATPEEAKRNRGLHFLAGSLAGVTSQSATYPLDLARARMAVTSSGGLFEVLLTVSTNEGFAALYRGYLATVLGVIPYAGVSFFTYDSLKHAFFDKFGYEQGPMVNLALGGVAGVLGQTSSYPLDVLRRRLQTSNTIHKHPIVTTISHIYSTEGWRGFFKGLSMNWVKGPIAVGISFSTYDSIKKTISELTS